MDEIERTSQETSEDRNSPDRSEQRDLQDATLDPRAHVEQSGDIRQAEEVQATFTAVVDNAGNATSPLTQPVIDLSTTLIPLPGALVGDGSAVTDKSPGSGSEGSSEDAAKKAVEDALKAFQKASGGTGESAGQMAGASVGDSGTTGSGMGGAKLVGGSGEAAGQMAGAMVGGSGKTTSTMGDAKVTGGTGENAGQIVGAMVGGSGKTTSTMGDAKLVDATGEGAGQTTGAEEGDRATAEPPGRISVEPPGRISGEQGGAEPAAGESVRQAAPAADGGPSAGESVRQVAPPAESGPVVGDSVRQAAPPAESGPAVGDSVRQAAPPAGESVRQVAPPAAESGPSSGESVRQAAPPAESTTGIGESQGAAVPSSEEQETGSPSAVSQQPEPEMDVPLPGSEGQEPGSPSAISDHPSGEMDLPLPGSEGQETGMDAGPVPLDEKVDGEGSEHDHAEAEEGWNPPDVYMVYGPDGKIVVVGADGKPINCPPIVSSADGASFFAYYPGMVDENGDPIKFEIKDYIGSLTDLYLYHDSMGKPIVVDKNGNPVSSPPSLASPDGATFFAYYGKAGTGEQVQLQAYKGSLTDLYLYHDSAGKPIVVDKNGNPVTSPPSLTSADGATFYASYDSSGTGESVQLQAYKGSLTDLYLHQDSTGKMIVVDAEGNPVASPPKIFSADGAAFSATYDSSGTGESVQLQAYKGSLTDVYLYQDSSGKMIVVDATGKPLTSQPSITSPDGATFYASYAGGYKTGDMVQLQYYKPPSNKPVGRTPL